MLILLAILLFIFFTGYFFVQEFHQGETGIQAGFDAPELYCDDRSHCHRFPKAPELL